MLISQAPLGGRRGELNSMAFCRHNNFDKEVKFLGHSLIILFWCIPKQFFIPVFVKVVEI